jgi:hypothetical protein
MNDQPAEWWMLVEVGIIFLLAIYFMAKAASRAGKTDDLD